VTFRLLHLKKWPILDQLRLEEALLRLSPDNYCILNEGSIPSIVMGISGKPEELIDLEKLASSQVPVIKRFSGGGTVVVDEETLFISFLCQKSLHPFAPYPEPIMRWTEELYKEALSLQEFHLRENDYAIGNRKVGGNAQYLRKEKWLHHSTFLWDYKPQLMDLLLHPKKTPEYRQERDHTAFLTKLSSHLPSKEHFIDRFKSTLKKRYPVEEIEVEQISPLLKTPHRKSTLVLT
jgi:lipoate---protein ligase